MKTIALVNNKGGVAKTTTAVNLSAALCGAGKKVLLIDLDCQASASLSLGVQKAKIFPSSAEVLIDSMPIKEAIRSTNIEGLDLITGSMQLANVDVLLAHTNKREFQLKNSLEAVKDQYDFVILDCPPSLTLLPVNALVAADSFIVPVVTHYLAMEGLVNLVEAVDLIRRGIGAKVQMLGIVLTMVDYRTKAASEIATLIRDHFKDKVFNTEIKVNVRLQEAPSHGKSIFQYDWASAGAHAYKNLAAEVIWACKEGNQDGNIRQPGEEDFQFTYRQSTDQSGGSEGQQACEPEESSLSSKE